jgi:hypothetical protein
MLGKMIAPGKRPVLFTWRGIEPELFFPQIDVFFQIPSQVHTIMVQTGIRVLHPLTVKNDFLHRSDYINEAVDYS